MQLMQCLGADDEVGLIVFEKNLSISKAIEGTKLKKLEKEVGEINTIVAICYLLNRFAAEFNVGKSLTKQQAAHLAADIVEKYPYETIEDVVLMLKQVRQGIIGDGKDYKLDGQNVLGKGKWFEQYLENKYAEFERIKRQENTISKEAQEQQKNAVQQYLDKRKRQQQQKQQHQKMLGEIDEMVKNMDRQMLEDTIADWEKKSEMQPYLDYLRRKRLEIKGDYKF